MIAYIDSSFLLRQILNQKNMLLIPKEFSGLVSSIILKTECYRTIERHRLIEQWNEKNVLEVYQKLNESIQGIDLIELNTTILNKAAAAFPLPIGTLDAIHLSSLIAWQEQNKQEIVLLTHDQTLAKAAMTQGIQSLG